MGGFSRFERDGPRFTLLGCHLLVVYYLLRAMSWHATIQSFSGVEIRWRNSIWLGLSRKKHLPTICKTRCVLFYYTKQYPIDIHKCWTVKDTEIVFLSLGTIKIGTPSVGYSLVKACFVLKGIHFSLNHKYCSLHGFLKFYEPAEGAPLTSCSFSFTSCYQNCAKPFRSPCPWRKHQVKAPCSWSVCIRDQNIPGGSVGQFPEVERNSIYPTHAGIAPRDLFKSIE